MKWTPKPDPVKRRPLATRRFYLAELAAPRGMIRHIPRPHQRRSISTTPPCLLSFSPSDCAPGAAFLASRGATAFHLNLHYPQRLAHDALLNRPGADDDADDNVDHMVGLLGLGISPDSVREAAWDDLIAVITITEPFRRRRELWSLYAPETSGLVRVHVLIRAVLYITPQNL